MNTNALRLAHVPSILTAPLVRRVQRIPANLRFSAFLLMLGYFAGAKLGFALTFDPQPVSTLWLPNAILFGALLLAPTSYWWLFIAAAFPAHLAIELPAGIPLLMMLGWFVSNCMEALIAALCFRRLTDSAPRLNNVPAVGAFVVAVLVAVIASSFLDAALVSLNNWGDSPFWAVWRHRTLSNTLAALIVVPVILALNDDAMPQLSVGRQIEAALLCVTLIAVSITVFGWQEAGPQTIPALLYAPLPFLLWAAVRFGPRGSAVAVFFVVLLAIWNTAHGRGPFSTASAAQNALSIQMLFLIVSITMLSLSAVVEELLRAEDAVHQKEEQLYLAMDAAQIGTWSWQHENDSPVWSQESRRIIGVDADGSGISYAHLFSVIDPADRNHVSRAVSRAFRNGSSLNVEFRVSGPDHSTRWLFLRGKVLRDPSQRSERMVGIVADVTERKTAETLRTKENSVLEMIANGAPLRDTLTSLAHLIESDAPTLLCSIVLLDPDGISCRQYVGPSLPISYVRAMEGIAIGPHGASFGAAIYTRKPVTCFDISTDPVWEYYRGIALRHDLRACWATPLISEDGAVLGAFALYCRKARTPTAAERQIMVTATQLSTIALERMRAEVDAHEQRRVVTHLGRVAMLGELTGSLVHELTQPLTAMLTNAQAAKRLLEQEPPRVGEVRDILNDIIASDRRASEVIHRLRAMMTKGHVQRTDVALDDVVVETLELLRSEMIAREVSVITVLPPGLPTILGDRVQLQQVLLNLSINACDAMSSRPPAERQLTLRTSIIGDGASVELSISDRGTGLPEGAQDKVFEPFYTSKEHGLGLGLSICRSIVAAHHGRLWATNNSDGGATFHVALPVPQPKVSRLNDVTDGALRVFNRRFSASD